MTDTSADWRTEFAEGDLAAIRVAIAESIRAGQERSARAQTEYADPDGDQDVYGAGMARAVQKELASRLSRLESYREGFVPGSRRRLQFVGSALVFVLRVGKRMPANHTRVRVNYLPEHRRELLATTSNTKYLEPGLFEFPHLEPSEGASLAEILELVESAVPRVTLFVPYYSSTPDGVGPVYWGPARLHDNHLIFTSPEPLTLARIPSAAEPAAKASIVPAQPGFAGPERKRTSVRLRTKPAEGTESL